VLDTGMSVLEPVNLQRLIDAFTRLMDVLGIRTSAGRLLLAAEVVIGPFLLVALALILLHEVYESLYAAFRGLAFTFHSTQHFTLFFWAMVFSFVIVSVREAIGKYL
jgi:hypothetical protein